MSVEDYLNWVIEVEIHLLWVESFLTQNSRLSQKSKFGISTHSSFLVFWLGIHMNSSLEPELSWPSCHGVQYSRVVSQYKFSLHILIFSECLVKSTGKAITITVTLFSYFFEIFYKRTRFIGVQSYVIFHNCSTHIVNIAIRSSVELSEVCHSLNFCWDFDDLDYREKGDFLLAIIAVNDNQVNF